MKYLFIASLSVILFQNSLFSQSSDTLFFIPVCVENIDTMMYDSSISIRFIDYSCQEKIVKRIAYNQDGKLESIQQFDFLGRRIWYISWYPNGQTKSYYNFTNGKSWYENGGLMNSTECHNDTCVSITYFNGGAIKLIEETSINGRPFHTIEYCENGQIISEDFLGEEYLYIAYHCNGMKKIVCKKNNKGYYVEKYCEWNENGKIAVKGHYASSTSTTFVSVQNWGGIGQREGKWKYYENGKCVKIEVYKKGELISSKLIRIHASI